MTKPVLLIDSDDFFQQLERLLDSKLAAIVHPEPQSSDSSEFLSRKQAADLLGVSLGTVDNLARGGIIQKHYLGSVPRFKREELLKAGQSWTKFQRN